MQIILCIAILYLWLANPRFYTYLKCDLYPYFSLFDAPFQILCNLQPQILDMAESDIMEGFLCPICKADLGTAVKLHSHFEEQHKDQNSLTGLKGLIDKAKSKIKKIDESLFASDVEQSQLHYESGDRSSPSPFYIIDDTPQTEGASRSHTDFFRGVRNVRVERYAAETNKLLIRLDKLLLNLPADPGKRKGPYSHEQAVVPWIDDTHVRLCPNCAKTFHLARRKHHCRLCGAVMCNDCTKFLELTAAKKMVNPSASYSDGTNSLMSPETPLPKSPFGILRRSNSSSSLNSVLSLVDTVTGEQHFRLCVHCKSLLDTRERQKETKNSKPILCQFYDRLRGYMSEVNDLMPIYEKMSNSLNSGETTYHLSDAQSLRVKILKLAESIGFTSEKIAVLGTKDVENPPRGNDLKLQLMIRSSATTYLKEQLLGLPNLPTEEELTTLRDHRRHKMTEQILQSRRLLFEEQQKALQEAQRKRGSESPHKGNSVSQKHVEQVNYDAGWGPDVSLPCDSEDPMIQQMNIIRNYIKQAREAHKYDEVSTLEQNLRELQEEYYRQQNSSAAEEPSGS